MENQTKEKEDYQSKKSLKRTEILAAIRKKRGNEPIIRLIREFEELIEQGNIDNKPVTKSVNKSSIKDTQKIHKLNKRIAKLEHWITSVSGLYAVDQDPKTVTKKWIVDNAILINFEL
jgi:hypothetical protein